MFLWDHLAAWFEGQWNFLWFFNLSYSFLRKSIKDNLGYWIWLPAETIDLSNGSHESYGTVDEVNMLQSSTQCKVCANIYYHVGNWRETSPRQNWKPSVSGILSRDDWWGLGVSKWQLSLFYSSEVPSALEMSCSEWCPCLEQGLLFLFCKPLACLELEHLNISQP